jgi:anthranilate phosphoribosyltransferase
LPANEADAFAASGGWPAILGRLFSRQDLSSDDAMAALDEVLAGRAQPSQIAAFLAALRTKGETVAEISGLVASMRRAGEQVVVDADAIDTCGTGGDRSGSINASTAAAFVAAAAGVIVCKHGNRAATSRAGSADVLEALGVAIELGPLGVARCVAETGIGFCFAPRFHPAMRFAGPVRSELGTPTVFNLLGPLANPARVTRQVIGVGDARMAETMLGVLEASGCVHAIVCFGHDGLDELTTTTTSTIYESLLDANGHRRRVRSTFDPRDVGITLSEPAALIGGAAAHNAERLRAIFGGERGPQHDFVVLNAAAALVVGGKAADLGEGVELAVATIDSGAAAGAVDRLVSSSQAAAAAGGD